MEGLDLSTLSAGVLEKAVTPDPTKREEVSTQVEVKSTEDIVTVENEEIVAIDEEKIEVDPKAVEQALGNLEKIEEGLKESSTTNTEKDKNSNDDPADSVYSVLTEFLQESGVLGPSVEVKDENTFIAAMKQTIEEAKYNGLSGAQKSYMDAIEAGIPEQEASNIANIIKNIGEVTETDLKEDEELAVAIITDDLKAQGWEHERIAKQISRLKASKELVEESLVSKDNTLERTSKFVESSKLEAKQRQDDAFKEEKAQLTKLKDAVYNYNKALTVVNVDDKLKNAVYNAMTTPVDQTEDGVPINALVKDRLTDPVDFEKRLYYTYVLTDGFQNISKLQRKAESTAAKKMKAAVEGLGTGLGSKGSGMVQGSMNMPDIAKV